MFQGKVKAAIQLLCNESDSKGGMLLLNSKLPTGLTVREVLISKHPIGQPIHSSAVLSYPFSGTGIGITSEGKRHLGAALGSRFFLESYTSVTK